MKFRGHQKALLTIVAEILSGGTIKEILGSITPGGGKSMLPIILAAYLIPAVADRICWLVPRSSLKSQGDHNFIDRDFLELIKHRCLIRAAGNDENPSRGTKGYITTYQGVVSNPALHWDEFSRRRYILFLDEPHHIAREGPWADAVRGLVKRSVLTVYASGTFERGDKNPIAFLPYHLFGKEEVLDLMPTTTRKIITYDRVQAIDEDAIIKLHFEMLDARAEWVDKAGNIIQVESLNEDRSNEDRRAALRTALTTEYAHELLDGCVAQWLAHRQTIYKLAKLLVVAPNIVLAKEYKKYLERITGLNVLIATSDDTKDAHRNIELYRNSPCHNILITVGMAYEGLDVKEITFVACLTFIRSKPWLEQCFARANRIAPGKIYGIVWGPRDHFFLKVVDKIVKQQTEAAVLRRKRPRSDEDEPAPSETNGIASLSSASTKRTAYDFTTGKAVDFRETEILQRIASQADFIGASTIQLKLFADESIGGVSGPPDKPDLEQPSLLTPKEQESLLRTQITKHVREYCIRQGIDFWIPHREIKARFGSKSIKTMTVPELTKAWAHVQKTYKFSGR